jgi:hypothetical protein
MARSKATKTEQELINAVMFEIDSHKPEIVNNLFPRCSDDYRLEWYNRDVFGFWCHMDGGNRRRVIELAKDRYAVGETSPDREAEKDAESARFFRVQAAKYRRAMTKAREILEQVERDIVHGGSMPAPTSGYHAMIQHALKLIEEAQTS